MSKKTITFILAMLLVAGSVQAQTKSTLHQNAEQQEKAGHKVNARAFWIRASKDYASKGQIQLCVECGLKAAPLYYGENLNKEASDLLNGVDRSIDGSKLNAQEKALLHYQVDKERMAMYVKMRKVDAMEQQVAQMEKHAAASGNDSIKNDALFGKVMFYYTQGRAEKGNDVLNRMMATHDSLAAKSRAAEVAALKEKIASDAEIIDDKDTTLAVRQGFIIGLSILAVALAVVLVLGAMALLRFIALSRKQKKEIKRLNENNALKAQFISNISQQISPSLQKLPQQQPEVKALLDFSDHIQTLSHLETTVEEEVELEDTQLKHFCEGIINQIRGKVMDGVELTLDVPQLSAKINKEYVSHILLHLLRNAITYTPAGGHITLAFKKRGAHKLQFLVSNTGSTIPEEKREDVFKPFLEVRDLTTGDGLGLPICKQMAVKMQGDLDIDPEFTKGVRFVLHLPG